MKFGVNMPDVDIKREVNAADRTHRSMRNLHFTENDIVFPVNHKN